jgi:hypothetical protein
MNRGREIPGSKIFSWVPVARRNQISLSDWPEQPDGASDAPSLEENASDEPSRRELMATAESQTEMDFGEVQHFGKALRREEDAFTLLIKVSDESPPETDTEELFRKFRFRVLAVSS